MTTPAEYAEEAYREKHPEWGADMPHCQHCDCVMNERGEACDDCGKQEFCAVCLTVGTIDNEHCTLTWNRCPTCQAEYQAEAAAEARTLAAAKIELEGILADLELWYSSQPPTFKRQVRCGSCGEL